MGASFNEKRWGYTLVSAVDMQFTVDCLEKRGCSFECLLSVSSEPPYLGFVCELFLFR